MLRRLNESRSLERFPKPFQGWALGVTWNALVTAFFASVLAVSPALAQGAGEKPPKTPPTAPGQDLMNPGDEVDGNAIEQRGRTTVPGVGIPGRAAGAGKAKAGTATPVESAPARWGVVLATFSDDGHQQMAKMACERLAETYPALKGCYARSTERGSVVMIGQFAGPKDDEARAMLDAVKAISPDGRARPFGRAYLSRVQSGSGAARSPYDLVAAAKRKMPNAHPLFTFQVAMWSDFDSKTLTQDEIEQKAEAHCKMLRARGLESFVHHDQDKHMSIVTIGVFDSEAYDPRSTLFSPPVERLFKQFPSMLVNGEDLLLPPPKGAPAGTAPTKQPCVLIEVPK